MKTPIAVEDIRKGDLIRWEGENESASEFRTRMTGGDAIYGALPGGSNFLLERPEPPFEPKDGALIVKPGSDNYYTAVRIAGGWMGKDDKSTGHWHGVDDWAKKKLAEGWIEIKENKND